MPVFRRATWSSSSRRGLHQHAAPQLDPDQLDDAPSPSIKDKIQTRRHLCFFAGRATATTSTPTRPGASARIRVTIKSIELCGKLGIPNIGGQSGTIKGKPLQQQVDEIVNVYTEKYFPLCEKHKVRILWEPYAGGPNIATGPVGWEALFKAFNDSPHVGLQFDPSHLVWQFMDPVQAAREFVDKIYDVHLKDTEILWHVVRRGGIQPVNNARWWRFRVPGYGSVDWKGFFSRAGRSGLHRRHEHRERRRVLLSAVRSGRISRSNSSAASAWRTNS